MASKIDYNGIVYHGLSKGLTLEEIFHLAFMNGLLGANKIDMRMHVINLLQDKGLVAYNGEEVKVSLTAKGKAFFKTPKRDNSSLAKVMREMFPPGLKDDKWPWRSTNVQIKEKLDRFFEIYPESTEEQIINATKNYLERMRDNDKNRSLLQYFILKNTDEGLKSILAEYIEVEGELKKEVKINPGGNITQI